MAAVIRVECAYSVPEGLEWAGKLNSSFHPPHATVDGREVPLRWNEPTEIPVRPGQPHTLEVYFRVFDLLRVCTANADVEPLQPSETRAFVYRVDVVDRALSHGQLSRVG